MAVRAAGLVLLLMAVPMVMTGSVLAMFLGMDYAYTSLTVGAVFLILGVITLALPRRGPPVRAVSLGFAAIPTGPAGIAIPETTVKVECPSCGASPSHVGPNRLTHCEYCGASFLLPRA